MSDPPEATAVPAPAAPAAVLPAPAPATPAAQPPLGRLTGIEIQNYRGFRGTFRLDLPKRENLLIYGENGSGKSSLFHSLRAFLEAPDLRVPEPPGDPWHTRPLEIKDNRHRFSPDADTPSIKLEFGTQSFVWSPTQNDTKQDTMRSLNKGKGFLDYIALLGVHYVRKTENEEVDLFPLLIDNLLPYYTYSHQGQNRTFQERWKHLNDKVTWRWTWDNAEGEFKAELTEFNDALEKAVSDLGNRASEMLKTFGEDFSVQFKYVRGEFKRYNKRIDGTKLLAIPAFRKLSLSDYPVFLNEARLSALAICLFFAALKESPATGQRLLVLDDILIGLDMTNRVKVVDLIRDNFKDWQIIILTYSKAWFERLKVHVKEPGWSGDWNSVVLWEEWREEDPSPHIVAEGSGTLIEMADRHLLHKDYKAAAVYARTALEALCNHTCAKAGLPTVHVEQPKDRQLEDYIVVLEGRVGQLVDETRRQSALQLMRRLREAQAFVLNRNAHFDVEEEDTLSGEVKAAIQTVKDLAAFCEAQQWRRANFKDGQAPKPVETLAIELAEARKIARFGKPEDAVKRLASAHHLAWEIFGAREKIMMPIREPLSAKSIWEAALGQTKLKPDTNEQLKAARPYLFGSITAADFDATQFEEAVKLLEQLAASPGA